MQETVAKDDWILSQVLYSKTNAENAQVYFSYTLKTQLCTTNGSSTHRHVFQLVPWGSMDDPALTDADVMETRVDSTVLACVNQGGQDLHAILEVFDLNLHQCI